MKQLSPVALLIWGVWILWAFGQTLVVLLKTEVDGVVVSSQDIPPNRGPRYATEYTMRGPDGHEFTYLAGPTGASLPRSMPVGTRVKKERWHLYFERNGRRENDSFPWFSTAFVSLGLASVCWSLFLWNNQHRTFRSTK